MFANWRAGAALLLISLGWLTPAQAVDIQRWQTAHGAKVLFVASHDNPLLDVRVDFDAGNRRDSADKPGVSDLTLTLLDAGTDALSEEAIKARLADLAAQLSGSSDIERAGLACAPCPTRRSASRRWPCWPICWRGPTFRLRCWREKKPRC